MSEGTQRQGAQEIAPQALKSSQAQQASQSARSLLRESLEARRAEIEEAIQNRVFSLEDPAKLGDATYTAGLREAVLVAIDYALGAVFESPNQEAPIPPALFAQARHAARNGVSLDTVLRRYFAGYVLLSDFVIREAEAGEDLNALPLRALSRAQARHFERLVAGIVEEYTRAAEELLGSAEQRRTECVRRLLSGEMVDTAGLAYEFEANHTAAVASGAAAGQGMREIAARLECRLLLVRPDETTLWAWLGSRRPIDASTALQVAAETQPEGAVMALGESARGIEGWRHSHRQAQAALPIARRRGVVRYADVGLLASMLQDEVLNRSLHSLYLEPLGAGSSQGAPLLETLRTYFASQRNVSSTAAALCVTRKTVMSRLRVIEERIDRQLSSCTGELEAAIHLEEIERSEPSGHTMDSSPVSDSTY